MLLLDFQTAYDSERSLKLLSCDRSSSLYAPGLAVDGAFVVCMILLLLFFF